MTTMVYFRTAGADYCVPVTATRAVRVSSEITALPAPAPDVAGIIPGRPPMTVISPFGTGGRYVLVIEAGDKTFGLLVDAVSGLRRVSVADISPTPEGQVRALISGTVDTDGQLTLVTDPDALAGRL